jgi:hypothetical protein
VKAVGVERDRAPLRDRHGVREGLLRPPAESLVHFHRALHVELVVVEPHPALVFEGLPHADAEQDLVGERVLLTQVVAVVRRDDRSAGFRREL